MGAALSGRHSPIPAHKGLEDHAATVTHGSNDPDWGGLSLPKSEQFFKVPAVDSENASKAEVSTLNSGFARGASVGLALLFLGVSLKMGVPAAINISSNAVQTLAFSAGVLFSIREIVGLFRRA